MSENKDTLQILQAVHGVSERVARLEEKLDEYHKIRATAYSAHELAEDNHQDILELKDNSIFSRRTVITTALALVSKIVYDIFRGH